MFTQVQCCFVRTKPQDRNRSDVLFQYIRRKKSMEIFEFTQKFMKKNPYEDSNMIKECLAVGSDSLFSEFRNKTEICNAIDWSTDLRVLSAECEMCHVTMNSK